MFNVFDFIELMLLIYDGNTTTNALAVP
jgi:hypothetical protein